MIGNIFVRLILLIPVVIAIGILGKQLYKIVTCQIGEEV